jgi:hypothetical protein
MRMGMQVEMTTRTRCRLKTLERRIRIQTRMEEILRLMRGSMRVNLSLRTINLRKMMFNLRRTTLNLRMAMFNRRRMILLHLKMTSSINSLKMRTMPLHLRMTDRTSSPKMTISSSSQRTIMDRMRVEMIMVIIREK